MKFGIEQYNTKARITALLDHHNSEQFNAINTEARAQLTYLLTDDDREYRGESLEDVIVPAPYWVTESPWGKDHKREYDNDDLFVEWRDTIYEPLAIGTLKETEEGIMEYIDSANGIPEVEFQCDRDGYFWHWYYGENYLRIWLRRNDLKRIDCPECNGTGKWTDDRGYSNYCYDCNKTGDKFVPAEI